MLPKKHYIDLVDGKFCKTSLQDLKALFQSLSTSAAADHLVLHFHGGLVSRTAAHKNAQQHLLDTYRNGNTYPVFVIWNSDVITAISKNLGQIAKDPIFHRLLKRLLQLLVSKLAAKPGARGAAIEPVSLRRMPVTNEKLAQWTAAQPAAQGRTRRKLTKDDLKWIEKELQSDPILIGEEQKIVGRLPAGARGRAAPKGPKSKCLSNAIVQEIQDTHAVEPGARGVVTAALVIAKHGLEVAIEVMKRMGAGRDHGLYNTIVEEIARKLFVDSVGAVIWSTMKQDTADAFATSQRGGAALVRQIKAWWKPERRVTLIGHSTGALYIGEFLAEWDRQMPTAAKADVVFLAPACTFEYLNKRLATFRRRAAHVRLFGLGDDIESGYWEVPGYYGSLLYIVSGLFEPDEVDIPIVGMQRFHSGKAPFNTSTIAAVRNNLIDSTVWSKTRNAQPGHGCAAEEHGGFEDDLTKGSLEYLLKHGL